MSRIIFKNRTDYNLFYIPYDIITKNFTKILQLNFGIIFQDGLINI